MSRLRTKAVFAFLLTVVMACGSDAKSDGADEEMADTAGSTASGPDSSDSSASSSGGDGAADGDQEVDVSFAVGSFCGVYEGRLRDCGIIGEGRFEACVDYGDAAESCEIECLRQATCADFEEIFCDVGEGYFPCFESCIGVEAFTCSDGTSLSGYYHCDGSRDCADGEDEVDCDDELDGPRTRCRNVDQWIDASLSCDGNEDCADGSDELDCTVMWSCQAGDLTFSVNQWGYCDGEATCDNGSDEPEGCTTQIVECSE